MFTRRILALAATLFTALTMAGTTTAATAMASPSYGYSVSAAGPSHHITPDSHCFICR